MLAVAAGMGVVVALTLGANEGPPEGAKPERVGGENPEQGGRPMEVAEKGASDELPRTRFRWAERSCVP